MTRYLIGRAGQAVFVLWAAYTATFLLLYVLPQDAVDLIFDPTRVGAAHEAEKERLRAYYGLGQPLIVQYVTQLGRVLTGDLGLSIQTGQPVSQLLARVLPETVVLSLTALAIAIVIALGLAVWAVSTDSAWVSHTLRAIPPAFVSVPAFIVGLLLLQVFSFQLHLLPSIGSGTPRHLVLPALTLAIPVAGPLAHLLIKSATIELRKPYATTAAAKGYRRHQVVWRDVLRNAVLPALTLAGLTFGNLLAGAIIVETVFSRPGIGRLSETAVRTQDVPVVHGVVLFGALLFVTINLVVDLIFPLVDPRLRAELEAGSRIGRAGQADRFAHLGGLGGDVAAVHAGRPGVRREQRRQDLHHRGLARAVGAEQSEDAPPGHVEIHSAQHVQIPVGLRQAPHADGCIRGHRGSPRSASSIALVRRARSLSIQRIPLYACAKASANSTGSSPTISRTGVPSTAARSHSSTRSPIIVTEVSPSTTPP